MCFSWHYGIIDFCCSNAEAEVNIIDLETIYPFSFEFKGRSLSDTRCMIQYVVSPQCGDKRMARRVRDLLCRTILSWRHFIGMRGKNVNVSNVSKAKEWTAKITWRHAQNVVSTRVLYKFINLISTFVICLKFVSIEMLDKLITCIVYRYSIWNQVLPVVWTSRYRDS